MNRNTLSPTYKVIAGSFILSIFILLIHNISDAKEENFGGIGVSIAQMFDPDVENKIGSLVVLDVFKGNAASMHGIKRGDIITHIDGESTKSKPFKYIIFNKMRGKIGSKINLEIKRTGVKTPLNIILTRQKISYSSENL